MNARRLKWGAIVGFGAHAACFPLIRWLLPHMSTGEVILALIFSACVYTVVQGVGE